jgi:hypothetical protein
MINVSPNARAINVANRMTICRLRTAARSDMRRRLAGPMPDIGLNREWARGAERSAPTQNGIQISRNSRSHNEREAGQTNSRNACNQAIGDHVARRRINRSHAVVSD